MSIVDGRMRIDLPIMLFDADVRLGLDIGHPPQVLNWNLLEESEKRRYVALAEAAKTYYRMRR